MLQYLRKAIVVLAAGAVFLSLSSRALADSEIISVSANGMTCQLPAGWAAASGDVKAQGLSAAKSSVAYLNQHLSSLQGGNTGGKGLSHFHMAVLPESRGFFAAYTIGIPQDRNYYNHAIAFANTQITNANAQGAGVTLNKNETIWINESRFLKTDITYSTGARTVRIDRWTGDDPDNVGQILFTFAPSATNADRQAMEATLASLQAEKYPVTNNTTIGPLTMYVPSEWGEMDNEASAAVRFGMAPQVMASFQAYAVDGQPAPALKDFKVFGRGSNNMIVAYTVTLPGQADYLQGLHHSQSAALDNVRAQMTSAECRRGLVNDVDVVQLAFVDANGGTRTTVQQWDAGNPGLVTVCIVNAASDAPDTTKAEATRIIRSISRAN